MITKYLSFKRTASLIVVMLAIVFSVGCSRQQPKLFDISCTLDNKVVFQATGFVWSEDDGVLSFREGTSWENSFIKLHRMAPKENCSLKEIAPGNAAMR